MSLSKVYTSLKIIVSKLNFALIFEKHPSSNVLKFYREFVCFESNDCCYINIGNIKDFYIKKDLNIQNFTENKNDSSTNMQLCFTLNLASDFSKFVQEEGLKFNMTNTTDASGNSKILMRWFLGEVF